MRCLICHSKIMEQLCWGNFLFPSKTKNLCQDCLEKFSPLKGPLCKICSKEKVNNICHDCEQWEKSRPNVLTRNVSLFSYNEAIRSVIARWKYRGDYELGFVFSEMFFDKFNEEFKKGRDQYVIIPIPLSNKRISERAFNQAKMLAGFLEGEVVDAFTRENREKQAKKSKRARIFTKNPFHLNKSIQKHVILVDDIYTTGVTLRHAATLLKEQGTPQVDSLTLVRG